VIITGNNKLVIPIDNNGSKHRDNDNKAWKIYRWLFNNNFPNGYQVMCWTCNMARYQNKGVCPHKSGVHVIITGMGVKEEIYHGE